jgi:hypothetical protein
MHDDLLRAALDRLGLAPGAGWSEILARYRHLAKVWHPDRFTAKTDKEKAEEKLKKIIEAKELLQMHYQSQEHRPNDYCICWGRASHPPPESSTRETQQQHQSSKQSTPPPSKPSPPPPPPKSPPPPPGPGGGKGKKKPAEPPENKTAWDWANELCGYLDIGPLTPGEPPWFETFRRMCDRILGKHPGETVMDVWEKPPTWTKEHKRKCLLIVLFTVMALDKIIIAIAPDAFKSPEQIAHPALPGKEKPTLPLSPFPDTSKPNLGPPVDLDSPEEIRNEEQYFDQKWQERERMLQGIRPGYKPPN